MDILPGHYNAPVIESQSERHVPQGSPVVIVGVDMPFAYMVGVVFKWALASALVGFLLGVVLWIVWMMFFGSPY